MCFTLSDTMSERSRTPRRWHPVRVPIYAACALVALAGAAYIILSSAWFRHRLEERMVRGLEDVTGGRVELSGFAFRPLILQVRIRELIVHGKEAAGGPPLFAAERVEVEISPAALIRRRIVLRRLQWRSAEIHLTTDPAGLTNLPTPQAPIQGSVALNELVELSIHDLVFAHTDLFWNNRKTLFDAAAKDAGLNLRLSSGPRYLGNFACSALSVQAPHWALPPSTLTGQFELARTSAKITSLVWRSTGLSGQGSLDASLLPDIQATATFRVNGDAMELAKYFRFTGVESGEITLEGQAQYQPDRWTSSGRVRARRLVPKDLPVNPGRMDFSAEYFADAQRAKVSNLNLSTLGGRIIGDAEARLGAGKADFRVRTRMEGLDLPATLGAFRGFRPWRRFSRFGAQISGTSETTWSGNFERLQSIFNLQLRPNASAAPGLIPASGFTRGTATFNRSLGLEITAATIETPQSRIEMHGKLNDAAARLAVEVSTADFEEWQPFVEFLAGVEGPIPIRLVSPATFTGTFSGPPGVRELRGRLEAGEFQFSGTGWGAFGGELLARPGLFQVHDGRLKAAASGVGLQVETPLRNWTWDPAEPVNVQLRMEGAELDDLRNALGLSWPVSGPLTGRLDLSGPASNLTGEGGIEINQGALGRVRFDSLSAAVRIAPSELHLENLRFLVGHGNVSGFASYNFATRAVTATLQGRNFSLAEINFPGLPKPRSPSAPAVRGLASFDVQGGGVLPDLKLSANWKLDAFELQGSPIGDLSGQLDWEGDELRLTGRSQGAGGALTVKAEAKTRGDWPVDLSGDFSGFEAAPWIRSFLNGRFNAQVTVGGSFRARGPLARLGEVQAEGHVEKLAVHVADLTWSNAQPFDASFAYPKLSIGRFQMLGPSTALEVAGAVEFGQPSSLDLTANGRADAKLLDLYDRQLQATGLSRLALHVTGSPAEPLVHGRLDVEGLSLSYGNLPFRVADLNGPIELQGDRATATALRGRSGGGLIAISGFATFAERPRVDVRASLDGVRVRYPFDFTSLLAGDLRLAATPEGGGLTGQIRVRQMFASENFNVLTLMSERSSALAAAPEGVSSPLAANIRLGVDVSSAPAVRLETNDFRLTLNLDLRLQGTLARPVEVGAVHILSGETVVRGNRYQLARGDITMANPLRTKPVLDLEATTRVEHYDVTLDLTGPLDQIKFAYRSDPPLAVGDILSLLALGYVRGETGTTTARSEQLQAVGASALLSEALSSQMTGRLQRLFGVSRVKVDPNVGGPTTTSGARITVEQEVTRNLTLTYITNTATSQQRTIQFEWGLSENISLVGIRDQNGIFGLELRFRRRFK